MERSLKRRQRSSAAPGGGPYSRTTQPQPRLLALEAHHAARRRGGHGTPRSACRSLPGFKGRTSGCRGGISGACELRTTRHGKRPPSVSHERRKRRARSRVRLGTALPLWDGRRLGTAFRSSGLFSSTIPPPFKPNRVCGLYKIQLTGLE